MTTLSALQTNLKEINTDIHGARVLLKLKSAHLKLPYPFLAGSFFETIMKMANTKLPKSLAPWHGKETVLLAYKGYLKTLGVHL